MKHIKIYEEVEPLREGPTKSNVKKFDDHMEKGAPPPPISKYSEEDWDVLSVKRLSDGEIFSVGDLIGLNPDNKEVGKIDRIWPSFEQMRIDVGNLGLVLNDDIVKLNK